MSSQPHRAPRAAGVFSTERLHVPFIVAALLIALFGGFVLAIALPVTAAIGRPGAGWVPHAQVHGHLQTVGFVGLCIVGVGYRLLPSFCRGRPLAYPRLAVASLGLIGGGVLLRAIGQPAADQRAFAVVLALGGWAEAAGAACFAANVFAMAWPAARAGDLFAPFFLAGAWWFLAQAVIGGWWLTALARDGQTVLTGTRDGLLVTLQFFGFILMFILGVGIRSFPVFFAARRPTLRPVLVAWALVQAGLAATTVGMLLDAPGHATPWLIEDAGSVLLGAGLLWTVTFTGAWRPPTRIRPASRPFALALQPAMAWLALAAALEAGIALRAAGAGDLPPFHEVDAVRHIVAVGVALMTVVAMAQLVLPEFASERLAGRQGAWRGVAFAMALSIAVVLRAGSRLFAPALSPTVVDWSMAVAGTITLGVILAFAALFARSVRRHQETLRRVAEYTSGRRALPLVE